MEVSYVDGYDYNSNLLGDAIRIEKSDNHPKEQLYVGITDEDETCSRVHLTTDQAKRLIMGLLAQLKAVDPTVDDAFLKELANI